MHARDVTVVNSINTTLCYVLFQINGSVQICCAVLHNMIASRWLPLATKLGQETPLAVNKEERYTIG